MSVSVYRLYDADDNLLYVGMSEQLHQRVLYHRSAQKWGQEISRMESEPFEDRSEASDAERTLIATLGPKYNVTYSGVDGRRAQTNEFTIKISRRHEKLVKEMAEQEGRQYGVIIERALRHYAANGSRDD